MVTIRNNRPASATLNFVGGTGRIELLPGITLGVSDADWEFAKRHPEVKMLLELGILEPLVTAPAVSELSVDEDDHQANFLVADDRQSGQPMPVLASSTSEPVDTPSHSFQASAPEISKALQLLNHGDTEAIAQLPSIGRKTANQLIERRPEHGYASLKAAEEANGDLTWVDWEAIANWSGE